MRVQNAPRHRLSVTSVSSPNGVIQRCYHTTKKRFRREFQFGVRRSECIACFHGNCFCFLFPGSFGLLVPWSFGPRSSGPLVLRSRGSVVTLVSSTIPHRLLSSLDADTLGPTASVGRRLNHIHSYTYMHSYMLPHTHADDGDEDVHEDEDDNDGGEDGGCEIML